MRRRIREFSFDERDARNDERADSEKRSCSGYVYFTRGARTPRKQAWFMLTL